MLKAYLSYMWLMIILMENQILVWDYQLELINYDKFILLENWGVLSVVSLIWLSCIFFVSLFVFQPQIHNTAFPRYCLFWPCVEGALLNWGMWVLFIYYYWLRLQNIGIFCVPEQFVLYSISYSNSKLYLGILVESIYKH